MLMTAKHGIEATGGDNLTSGQDLRVMLRHGRKSRVGTPSCKHHALPVRCEALPTPWSLLSCPLMAEILL